MKRRAAPRPFRCPLAPFIPLCFAAVVLAVDVFTFITPDNRRNPSIGLAILAAGVPVWFAFDRRGQPSGT